MRTKYLLLTLGAVSALAISGPANAAHVVVVPADTTLQNVSGPFDGATSTTIGFSDFDLAVPNFLELLTFENTEAGQYNLAVNTSNSTVDFTDIFISGISGTFNLTQRLPDGGGSESWERSGLILGAGTYTLSIAGLNSVSNASLQGAVTITQAPVPEPGTWAMMLLGFGAIGFAMRRRKQAEGTKRIRLSYS